MKLGNVLLLIVATIFTFIGLAINKIYTIYVKKNIFVQTAIYTTFTLIALRILYWIAKPIFVNFYNVLKSIFGHVNITFTCDPSISVTLIGLLFLAGIAWFIKAQIEELK